MLPYTICTASAAWYCSLAFFGASLTHVRHVESQQYGGHSRATRIAASKTPFTPATETWVSFRTRLALKAQAQTHPAASAPSTRRTRVPPGSALPSLRPARLTQASAPYCQHQSVGARHTRHARTALPGAQARPGLRASRAWCQQARRARPAQSAQPRAATAPARRISPRKTWAGGRTYRLPHVCEALRLVERVQHEEDGRARVRERAQPLVAVARRRVPQVDAHVLPVDRAVDRRTAKDWRGTSAAAAHRGAARTGGNVRMREHPVGMHGEQRCLCTRVNGGTQVRVRGGPSRHRDRRRRRLRGGGEQARWCVVRPSHFRGFGTDMLLRGRESEEYKRRSAPAGLCTPRERL
jgi:hypothetical protein